MTSRPIDREAVNNLDYFLSRGGEHEAECIEAMSLLFSIPDNESCGACTCSCIFTSRLPLANIVSKPISWRQTNTGPFKESGIAFIPPINLINERWPRYKNRFAHSKNRKSSPRFANFSRSQLVERKCVSICLPCESETSPDITKSRQERGDS